MTVPAKIWTAIVGILFLAMVMPAAAQAPSCAGISDNDGRLACQIQKRRGYGTGLERALWQEGFDASVFVEEAGEPGSGAYPRLIIWTFLANGQVHEINSKARILQEARSVGFRMLVYVDKGEENNWYFDLTRPGSAALDVVPWQLPPWKRDNPVASK